MDSGAKVQGTHSADDPATRDTSFMQARGEPSTVPKISGIILDIGDVLCNWTPPHSLAISPAMLHRFRKTRVWYEYNIGFITETECYGRLAEQYNVSASDIAEAVNQIRGSLAPNHAVFDAIRRLRARYQDSLQVFILSNIPSADWKILRENPDFDWSIFDGFFVSNSTGMAKPELRSFRHVLQKIEKTPEAVVFVDDNPENVLAARSLGIRSLRFQGVDTLERLFQDVFHDPIARGREYLRDNAKRMWSETHNGKEVRDNFAQLLLYETTCDLDLVIVKPFERTWNYFMEYPLDTVEKYPDDVDTTSMALLLLPNDVEKVNDILDDILKNVNADGIIMTYFDDTRPRVDSAVCINALRLFYKMDRGSSPALQPTKDWILDVLFYRAYLDGTYYYPSGDIFLYLFSRLLTENQFSDIYRNAASLLRERLKERIGASGDALELAMRIIACHDMGVPNIIDSRRLQTCQMEDGGWQIGWLCNTGKTGLKIGNRGLTTALSIKAIDMVRKNFSKMSG